MIHTNSFGSPNEQASTVSLTDCIIRRGMWYESIAPPITPGIDVVGTICRCGSAVVESGDFKVGDRVAALIRTGGNARYATVPSTSLIKVPKELVSCEVASLVSTYMTAFQALDIARQERENLKGVVILITGGNGAIG